MAVITGRVVITVNGQVLLNKAGAKIKGIGISGKPNFEVEMITGDSGVHGFVEKPIVAELEVTVSDKSDISLDAMAQLTGDFSVTFNSANAGKQYSLQDPVCIRNFELTAGQGETTLKFAGSCWVEILP